MDEPTMKPDLSRFGEIVKVNKKCLIPTRIDNNTVIRKCYAVIIGKFLYAGEYGLQTITSNEGPFYRLTKEEADVVAVEMSILRPVFQKIIEQEGNFLRSRLLRVYSYLRIEENQILKEES